ncbi:signal peptide peptidase SppA [Catenovulum sediminis]|uniref:signal peptide peptidase SppA n=1 Tax=Catenovulum sediminis TaxID=1740262 RepID=UPI00117C3BDB|nr:signal peptide peptidase SppA [Catenovulum sediminis]
MTKESGISRLFSALWGTLNFTRKLALNMIFFGVLIAIILTATSERDKITVPKSSALVLNLAGNIVEQKQAVDPVEAFLNETMADTSQPTEILLSDILLVLDNAQHDDRIKVIVLDLQHLTGAGINKLETIGDKLNQLKANGKKVVAVGDYYSKGQYFLATYADEILMHPMGFVQLDGFSVYNTYFKSALEKLKVSTYVFRVGTYKSFVEPFIRDNMSEEAKEANKDWLMRLWHIYKTGVAQRRDIDISDFDEKLAAFERKFEEANYDHAQYALNNNWVDQLATREEIEQVLAEQVGWTDNKRSYNKINFQQYLTLVQSPILPDKSGDKVALVVAKGTIYDGTKPAGEIGGDSTAKLLERARLDDQVKAVVIRIDSPGGSAFASEIIRREIELLQAANKPVVASMSTTAASGGYWIASSADQIWAHPSTVTGSIGVFGLAMTFEKSLGELGIHADGISTTEWPVLHPAVPIEDRVQNILQKSTERVYQRFLQLVSQNRNMTIEEANKVAQGRIWIGEQAQQLGLVDHLGNMSQAIEAAAELAGLENYSTKLIEAELSPQQQFIKEMLGQAYAWFADPTTKSKTVPVQQELLKLIQNVKAISEWNDPKGQYTLCIECP